MDVSLSLPDNIKQILQRKDLQISFGIVLLGLILATYIFQWQQARIKSMRGDIKLQEEKIDIGTKVLGLDGKIFQISSPFLEKSTSLNLKELKKIASDYEIGIVSATEDEESLEFYRVLLFKLNLQTNYHNLGKFISALESHPDLLEIRQLSVKHKQDDMEDSYDADAIDKLEVDMELSVTFVK